MFDSLIYVAIDLMMLPEKKNQFILSRFHAPMTHEIILVVIETVYIPKFISFLDAKICIIATNKICQPLKYSTF